MQEKKCCVGTWIICLCTSADDIYACVQVSLMCYLLICLFVFHLPGLCVLKIFHMKFAKVFSFLPTAVESNTSNLKKKKKILCLLFDC